MILIPELTSGVHSIIKAAIKKPVSIINTVFVLLLFIMALPIDPLYAFNV